MSLKYKKALCIVLIVSFLCGAAGAAFAEEVISTINSAKTVQAFTQDDVSSNDLYTILNAGLSATSAINQQPWHFVAIADTEVMTEINGSFGMNGGAIPDFENSSEMPEFDGSAEGSNKVEGDPDAQFAGSPGEPSTSAKASLGDSPVAIIIYMDKDTSSPNASFDCGLACQNMVIAATALGYGTKIVSSPTMTLNGANHDALCEQFGVPVSMEAIAVLLIGYPDNEVDGVSSASVRNSFESKVSMID